ncbi:MAG: hypothetical protein ACE5E5_02350 [Phycisphaerae bacterium]
MTHVWEWLLGLDGIRLGRDAPVFLRFDALIPAWLLFCLALIAALAIFLVYKRERVSVGRRVLPALLRAALVTLIGAVLCEPALVLQRNRVEPSHVIVMIDRSRSMAAMDRYLDAELAAHIVRGAGLADAEAIRRHSRLELVTMALRGHDDAAGRRLLERNGLVLCSFSGSLEPHGFFGDERDAAAFGDALEPLRPDGLKTDLVGALRGALDRSRGRRISAIILASDGQKTEPAALSEALNLAHGRHIPIIPIRIGSTFRPRNVDVGPLRAEPTVFVNDLAAIEFELSTSGFTERKTIDTKLIDVLTGATMASARIEVDPQDPVVTVELRMKPTRVGRRRYRVEAEPVAGESSLDDNASVVEIDVLDDQLDVLYVEGYPRYEYRYLKNALLREKTINVSVLLLEADSHFVQEGAEPIRAFPTTPEALRQYDVVLFGDVDPRGGWLSEAQMAMLLDFVGNEGGGFGLIAGERFAPQRFLGTPLERLLPIRIDPSFLGRHDASLDAGFPLQLTPVGRRSRLFQFADVPRPEADRRPEATLVRSQRFGDLPDLYWYARSLGAKPGASVLAEHPYVRLADGLMPVAVSGRYGAGKLLFFGTDDSWRWRRHTGELFHDAFWVQFSRELMRGARSAQDRRYRFRTDRRVYEYGQSVRVLVEILDPALLALQSEAMDVDVLRLDRERNGDTAGLIADDRMELHRIGDAAPIFEGTYLPPAAGGFVFRAKSLSTSSRQPAATVAVRVAEPNLEGRRPEADHATLATIAEATGGKVIDLDELEAAFAAIANRSVEVPDDVVEPLWDSRLALILFAFLIGAEWMLRKAFGLP